jgi:hypothetical protein
VCLFPEILDRVWARHAKDYADLSATPDQFKAFAEVVGQMHFLPGVNHFAPLQRPEQFNSVMLLSSTRFFLEAK